MDEVVEGDVTDDSEATDVDEWPGEEEDVAEPGGRVADQQTPIDTDDAEQSIAASLTHLTLG